MGQVICYVPQQQQQQQPYYVTQSAMPPTQAQFNQQPPTGYQQEPFNTAVGGYKYPQQYDRAPPSYETAIQSNN